MQRGFKSSAEQSSLRFRREMRVPDIAPLSMRALAKHLKVLFVTPEQIPGILANDLLSITSKENGWSALCMHTPQGNLIIHNSSHEPARQESDIAHELSHTICGHKQDGILPLGDTGIFIRTFDTNQEEEAAYLGGCLQIPQTALVHCLFRNMSNEEIAAAYHASPEMVRYRINASGAGYIVQNTRKRGRNRRANTPRSCLELRQFSKG